MAVNKIENNLSIPFKDFAPGQIIESKQFNDDFIDIEDKVNEIIDVYNSNINSLEEHTSNVENPHQVTSEQVGTYDYSQVDEMITDLKSGDFDDGCVSNRVLGDEVVNTRVIENGSITSIKVDSEFGSQIDISKNIEITDRYTKLEINEIISNKVGDGTYSKEIIDEKFGQVQAGQIIDKTITIDKLVDNIGYKIDISNNPSVLGRYSNLEIDTLIQKYGLPKDWGNILDEISEEELGEIKVKVDGIDDGSMSAITTWSSNKINTQLYILEQEIQTHLNNHPSGGGDGGDDNTPKDAIILKDQVTGNLYTMQMKDGFIACLPIDDTVKVVYNSLPTRTEYHVGDYFNTDGLEIRIYTDELHYTIADSNSISVIPEELSSEDIDKVNIILDYDTKKYIQIQPISYVPFDESIELQDFNYSYNGEHYELNSWKGTLNGIPSTDFIVPDTRMIII